MTEKINALRFVLDFEAKGAAAYLNLAAKAESPLGKKLFYSLAAEEVQHARKADEFYSKAGAKWLAVPVSVSALEGELKGFFDKLGGSALKKSGDDIQGYELAMGLEREGYRAYEGFLKDARTNEEKEFFRWILAEEKEHLAAIANVYHYLTGSGDWLQEDESRTWNWMNL